MPLVDSHCHLQDAKFDEDREAVIARALDSLDWLVVIGDDVPSSRAGLGLTREGVYAAVGVHPYHAGDVDDATISELREMARNARVVAIGEIGLDYFKYNETPRSAQHEGLERQLDLAAELRLPIVVHNREAHADLGAILDAHHRRLPAGVMHCFAGDVEFMKRAVGWGFFISFAGNVTFPKAAELREVAREVPLDRLLVETDSPYLAPQAVRGKRNEPAYVQHTTAFLATLHDMTAEEMGAITAENAGRLFRVG